MKERPILFSASMVRANRAGRKMQTRRPLKWPVLGRSDGVKQRLYMESDLERPGDAMAILRLCPYGKPGDRLWVRETWATRLDRDDTRPIDLIPGRDSVYFWADPQTCNTGCGGAAGKRRPSIFMPRWACRNVYEITEVRVQRVNEISEEDARAEGFSADPISGKVNGKPAKIAFYDPIRWYAALWDAINGDRAPWASRPWAWAITYKPVAP
jgi:hypothetical protein